MKLKLNEFLLVFGYCNIRFVSIKIFAKNKFDTLDKSKKFVAEIYNYVSSLDFSFLHEYLSCDVESMKRLDTKNFEVIIYRKD